MQVSTKQTGKKAPSKASNAPLKATPGKKSAGDQELASMLLQTHLAGTHAPPHESALTSEAAARYGSGGVSNQQQQAARAGADSFKELIGNHDEGAMRDDQLGDSEGVDSTANSERPDSSWQSDEDANQRPKHTREQSHSESDRKTPHAHTTRGSMPTERAHAAPAGSRHAHRTDHHEDAADDDEVRGFSLLKEAEFKRLFPSEESGEGHSW